MKISARIVLVSIICLSFYSCKKQHGEPDTITYVTFVNNSSHSVSVAFDGIAPWCDIDNFALYPNDKLTFSYEGLGLDIFKATVSFDSKIAIVHEKQDASNTEGLRNICYSESHWWEKKYDNSIGYKAYYSYSFEDSDYDFAVNHTFVTCPLRPDLNNTHKTL